ncbi:MAG: hypothetical protein FWC26_02675 [Fibromonadales bacterium]|nr:hypothetical protein [Fibromonadales bacterium]
MASSTKIGAKFFATAICVASFSFFSCSDGGDGGSTGSKITEVYKVKEMSSNYLYVIETYNSERCSENGFKDTTREYTFSMNYSIDNKVLSLWEYSEDEMVKFNGTSNEIIGTWTRNKNLSLSCRNHYDDDEYDGYWCDDYYDVVKLVVSEKEVAMTRDVCRADETKDGEEVRGWKIKTLGCDSYELSKGNDKIKLTQTMSSAKVTYNGKSCSAKEPTHSEKVTACNKAIAYCKSLEDKDSWCIEDSYYDFRDESFQKCMINLLPKGDPWGYNK